MKDCSAVNGKIFPSSYLETAQTLFFELSDEPSWTVLHILFMVKISLRRCPPIMQNFAYYNVIVTIIWGDNWIDVLNYSLVFSVATCLYAIEKAILTSYLPPNRSILPYIFCRIAVLRQTNFNHLSKQNRLLSNCKS